MGKDKLPKAECGYGYPEHQLRKILHERGTSFLDFCKFMRGQTFTSCDGNCSSRPKPTRLHPHGFVYYTDDVHRFLHGLPVIDW